jgi:biopolymer transport protein ExbD
MAEIIQEEKSKGGKKKAKRHIHMTPMVDLMCLLITFFMLVGAMSKSKVMDLILPERIKDPTQQEAPRIAASRTLNILLGPNDKVYTYPGTVKPEDYSNLPPLTETDLSANGIRKLLLERNRALFKKIADFKADITAGKISIPQDSVQSAVAKLKKEDDTGPIVLIKAYKTANYGDFVNILDEMNICGIASYMFTKIAWYEEKMIETAAGISPTATTASSPSAK